MGWNGAAGAGAVTATVAAATEAAGAAVKAAVGTEMDPDTGPLAHLAPPAPVGTGHFAGGGRGSGGTGGGRGGGGTGGTAGTAAMGFGGTDRDSGWRG